MMNHDYAVTYLVCNGCDYCGPARSFEDDPVSGEVFCPECGSERTEFSYERPAEWVQLAVYYTDRSFGGPEEGGWYYDTGTILPETVRSFVRGDFPQIRAYRDLMRDRYEDCVVRVYVERNAPEAWPERRPTYC